MRSIIVIAIITIIAYACSTEAPQCAKRMAAQGISGICFGK